MTVKQYIFDDMIHVITVNANKDKSQDEIAGFALAAAEKMLSRTLEFRVRGDVLDRLDCLDMPKDAIDISEHVVWGEPRSSPIKAIEEANSKNGVVIVAPYYKFENGDTKFHAAWISPTYDISKLN